MRTEKEIKERIDFLEKQKKQTKDDDYKIACGMIIGHLKWVLIGDKNEKHIN